MKRRLLAAALLCFPFSGAQAASGGVLLRALTDEMDRTMARLRMDGMEPPYFAAYTVRESRRFAMESTFGALKDPHWTHSRQMKIDLRVGDRAFDNTHYVGKDYWNTRPTSGSLTREDDYDALRNGIWLLTDEAYKTALERFSQKKAYKQNKIIKEELPDLSEEPVQNSQTEGPSPEFPREMWERRLQKLSAIFKDYSAIQSSKVALYWTDQTVHFVDSEGRSLSHPDNDYELYVTGQTQAPDGLILKDEKRLILKKGDQFPPFSLLEAEVAKLARHVAELASAPLFDEDYIGPLLFEDQAAGEFFNQLLARNISFPRELWIEEEDNSKKFHTGSLTGRLGLRVISPFLSVEDDPGLRDFEGVPLIGHYAFDDEGIPARRVSLIENGILKDLPMSRSPIKKLRHSNGHGRASLWEMPRARVANMVVYAEKTQSLAEMKADLIRRAVEFGLDHAYIARRLQLETEKKEEEVLSAPVLLYRIDTADGRETLVRNAQFSSVTLRALRDIVAAGDRRHIYNFYQTGPEQYNPGQMSTTIAHPPILVAEMELKRTGKKPDKLPILTHPHFPR